MGRPKIRHVALFADDPDKLVKFYVDVFSMELIHRSPIGACYVTDGYINLAILPHALVKKDGTQLGYNHIGFQVDDTASMSEALVAVGAEQPWTKSPHIPFAEYNAADLEGNLFDLSVNGWDVVRPDVKPVAASKELETS